MKRNLESLKQQTFDILIIGGGIYGAALAREAATRGLKTALLEKGDFCSATSANSLKIIHGGLRYLQQADIPRVFESINERRIMLKTAPHLITPLPCMMPTRGIFLKSRPVMQLGLLANDILSFYRNRGLDKQHRIPMGKTVSRTKCLEQLPGLQNEPLTGAAVWTDGLTLDTERLVIGMLKAAAAAGATLANYVEARQFLMNGNRVTGVMAKEMLNAETAPFPIEARMVINATGAWESELLNNLNLSCTPPLQHLALAMNVIVKNWPIKDHAVGLQAKGHNRLYFFVPWRGATLAGTYYREHRGPVDSLSVSDDDIETYLDALNACLPNADLTRQDILAVHAGVLPCRKPPQPDREPKLLRHYRFIDHERKDGIAGLASVLGIKYTTARGVAETVISKLAAKMGISVSRSATPKTPLPGGDITNVDQFQTTMKAKYPDVNPPSLERLITFYGTEAESILTLAESEALARDNAPSLLQAELLFVIRHEAPQTLADLLYRRTGLGSAGPIDEQTIRLAADVMATACGWSSARKQNELQAVQNPPTLWQAGGQARS